VKSAQKGSRSGIRRVRDMKRHFIWTSDFERAILQTLSNKSSGLASNSGAVVTLFGHVAEASAHYCALRGAVHVLIRDLKKPNMSSIYRVFERNQRLWEGVGQVFNAIELYKVLNAPTGSIVIPKFEMGGYAFEIIKKGNPDYVAAFSNLPGAC
jgi:hypothetical protein